MLLGSGNSGGGLGPDPPTPPQDPRMQHIGQKYIKYIYIHVHTLFFITVNGQQGSRRGGANP